MRNLPQVSASAGRAKLSPMSGMTRREFAFMCSAAAAIPSPRLDSAAEIVLHPRDKVSELERPRVLKAANAYLKQRPKTIVSAPAPRSAGGPHDFYSEGDYWWPDPKNPDGPYIRRDGESNPANFTAHRELLIRLSLMVPALAAAWLLTRNREFASQAVAHLRAWFIEPATRMNPNLLYAQAIHGIDTGRSIGIIDTVHLVEVAQAALVLDRGGVVAASDADRIRSWFADYLNWLTTSEPGHQERDAKNNHGSCWLLQAAEFAAYARNSEVRDACRDRWKNVLLPSQVAPNGSFPLELGRTKPYSYSLFNLDVLAMCAQVLSDPASNLWAYKLADGRGLGNCFEFMVPYVANKGAWPYRHDVEYFDDLPARQPSLLFAGLAFRNPQYVEIWEDLNPDPTVPEVIRNHPIRQPVLWMQQA